MADDKYTEGFVDSGLIESAGAGCRASIQQMARLAADQLAGQDDITEWLRACLTRLAQGEEPDVAFGWKTPGRPLESHEFLYWTIAQHVADLIKRGLPRHRATGLVAAAVAKSDKLVEAAYDRFRDEPIPENCFPIPEDDLKLIRQMEQRLAERDT